MNSVRLKRDVEPLYVFEFDVQARAPASLLAEIGVSDGLRNHLVQAIIRHSVLQCVQDPVGVRVRRRS